MNSGTEANGEKPTREITKDSNVTRQNDRNSGKNDERNEDSNQGRTATREDEMI